MVQPKPNPYDKSQRETVARLPVGPTGAPLAGETLRDEDDESAQRVTTTTRKAK